MTLQDARRLRQIRTTNLAALRKFTPANGWDGSDPRDWEATFLLSIIDELEALCKTIATDQRRAKR